MNTNNKNNLKTRALLVTTTGLGLASQAHAAVPVITTGNSDMDAAAVILLASIAAIAAFVGLGAGIKGSITVWNKVVGYFKKAV